METRANYVLIGGFTAGIILALFAFVIWLGHLDLNREVKTYDVLFNEAVTGLSQAGDVRYNGIKVGQVKKIGIAKDPNKVQVRVEVDAKTPVKEDTFATLEYTGLTGVAYVQLKGANPKSPDLAVKPDQEYPIIASKSSGLQDLFSGAPQLIGQANDFVGRLNMILDERNRNHITAILENAERVTGVLANSSDRISSLIENVDDAAKNINALSADLRKLAHNANDVVDKDLRNMVHDTSVTAQSATRAAEALEALVKDNSDSINHFANNGLGNITQLSTELRTLVRTLDRVAGRLDNDPSILVYGAHVPEVDLKGTAR